MEDKAVKEPARIDKTALNTDAPTSMAPVPGMGLSRRGFLAAVAVAGAGAGPLLAQQDAGGVNLSGQGHYFIRGAYALTMDPELRDIPEADVIIRDGRIAAIGRGLALPADAHVIDGRKQVIMPGFVDTHWHMWSNFLRGLILDGNTRGYFPIRQLVSAHIRPEDHYTSILFGQAEAIHAGITTVCNHSHGLQSPAYADAELQAHIDSGARTVFAHGNIANADMARELDRVTDEWIRSSQERLRLMSMAAINADNVRIARERGIMITMHSNQNNIVEAGRQGLLGPDVQIVHLVGAWGGSNAEGRQLVAASGAKISIAPFTAGIGPMGFPSILDLFADGVSFDSLGLSIDTSAQASADLFAAARAILHVTRQSYAERNPGSAVGPESQYAMTPRQALELATLGGARNLGLEQEIGSLTPGKKADVITVRMDALNMMAARGTDPTRILVQGGQPANVDTVFVDGRLLKYQGQLTTLDARTIAANAANASEALQRRAGLPEIDLYSV